MSIKSVAAHPATRTAAAAVAIGSGTMAWSRSVDLALAANRAADQRLEQQMTLQYSQTSQAQTEDRATLLRIDDRTFKMAVRVARIEGKLDVEAPMEADRVAQRPAPHAP